MWNVAYSEPIDFGGVTEGEVPSDEPTEVVTNDVG
jgi:hypothetical protein